MAKFRSLIGHFSLAWLQIYGIRYGLRGFYSRGAKPLELNARAVEGIHLKGGTILVRRGSVHDLAIATAKLPRVKEGVLVLRAAC